MATMMLNTADGALSKVDRAAAHVGATIGHAGRAIAGEQNAAAAIALASNLNARAEAAAQLAHSHGQDHFKRVRSCANACTGIFARYAVVAFLASLLPFAFAVGLLAYTEQNKNPLLGFGPTHTAWREALTSIVITASALCWHAIFLRHQTVLLLMGSILKYCAIAIFVIASYDQEAATTFCSSDPFKCNTSTNPQAFNPATAGNLFPAPYLDYACVCIWLFGGGVIRQRGEIIQAEIAAAEREAQLLHEISEGAGGAAGAGEEASMDKVNVQVR